jgi:plastocyanin
VRRFGPFGLVALASFFLSLLLPGLAAADAPQQSTPQQISINMSEFAFTPSTFTATVGQPVQITVHNVGKFPHNLSFELDSANIDQKIFANNIAAGQSATATFTFTAPGSWRMYCPVDSHAERGMVGTVSVAAPGALPQTGSGGLARLEGYAGAAVVVALLAGVVLVQRRARAHRS